MAELSMDFVDAKMVLGALVDDMFEKHFPDLKLNGTMYNAVLEVYLDFVSDKAGYWTAVKASLLVAAHLNLRETKSSPLHEAQVLLDWAIKTLELLAKKHEEDNRLIPLALPGPDIRRFFQQHPGGSPDSGKFVSE